MKPPFAVGVVAQYCCYEANFSIFLLLLRPRSLFSRLNEKMCAREKLCQSRCFWLSFLLAHTFWTDGVEWEMIYLLVIEALRRVNCRVDDLLT